MALRLGYWNIRGLAQPIRLLLAYTETPFVEKRYDYGPAPDFDMKSWLDEKYSLGMDFPNLPYLIDGDMKLSQSTAILRYLARKYKLVPESEEDKRRADLTEQQIIDIRIKFHTICYEPDFEELKVEYLKNLPSVLKPLSTFLGERKWFASDNKPTYVDFLVYENMDCHKLLDPHCLDDFKNLKNFTERFEKLPTIKKYMQSKDFLKSPLNADMAYFGARSS